MPYNLEGVQSLYKNAPQKKTTEKPLAEQAVTAIYNTVGSFFSQPTNKAESTNEAAARTVKEPREISNKFIGSRR